MTKGRAYLIGGVGFGCLIGGILILMSPAIWLGTAVLASLSAVVIITILNKKRL